LVALCKLPPYGMVSGDDESVRISGRRRNGQV
jgi:hypothetical protein